MRCQLSRPSINDAGLIHTEKARSNRVVLTSHYEDNWGRKAKEGQWTAYKPTSRPQLLEAVETGAGLPDHLRLRVRRRGGLSAEERRDHLVSLPPLRLVGLWPLVLETVLLRKQALAVGVLGKCTEREEAVDVDASVQLVYDGRILRIELPLEHAVVPQA